MKTAQQIIATMKADKCLTPSRSRSHKKHNNYSNKYTRCLAKRGCKGIDKDGYFTKFYDYGVVGHCCIGVQAHLIWAGYPQLVPKNGYKWNTNKYAAWMRTEPVIEGLGKVNWTSNPSTAAAAAKAGKMVVVFKGQKGHKSYSHTCTLLSIKNKKVKTVDFNINSHYKGKKINNGVEKTRKLNSYRWGFAILPIKAGKIIPKTTTKKVAYKVGNTYTLLDNMNVRQSHTTKSKIKTTAKRGEKIKVLKIYKTQNTYWVKTNRGWICAKTKTKTHIK